MNGINYQRTMFQVIFSSLLILLVSINNVFAQEPIKVTLNKEKQNYVQISGTFQFWLRYTELNPGSLVDNVERTDLFDFSVRRYRINFNGKASDRLKYALVLGNNNINHYTYKNPQIRILDAYLDYEVNGNWGFGIGKNGWTGLSRYAAPSASQPLAFDIDFASIPLVVVYDDILRRFGVYVRGNYHNFDFRISLSRPSYFPGANLSPIIDRATFSDKKPLYQFSSYLKYQFWDKESQNTPWAAGTYLGKKKILNIGSGILFQPNTTWYLSERDTVYQPISSFAVDLFYDKPLTGNKSLTFYVSYLNHNIGKNFIRNIGINNPATGIIPSNYINGAGNRAPIVGTGDLIYMQMGFLLPADKKNKTQVQPYGSFTYGQLQALGSRMILYNTGFNYYLKGQRSKITFGYENRPVFKMEEHSTLEAARRGMYVLQYQLQF